MKLHLPLKLRIALLSVCLPLITPCAEGRQYIPDTTITLVGSYIRDGYSSDDDKQQGFECKDGGALHVNGQLTMSLNRNVIFTSNRAGKSGGAVYASSWDNGFSYIQNLIFGYNKAEGSMNPCSNGRLEGVAGGGGIFGCDYITNCDSVVFSSNKATSGSGGGMLSQRKNLGLTDNDSIIFRNNHAAADGGAIALKPGSITGTFAASNCILSVKNNKYVGFSHNKAECGNGGAIDAIGVVCSGNIENGVLFQSNSAAVNGGAIYADYFTCVGNKGTGISFVGNSAEYGGAVYAASSNYPGGTLSGELAYSVYMSGNDCIRFADNVATGEKGGAIYAKADGYYRRNLYIVDNENVVFENNRGGAIYSGDDVRLQGNKTVRFQGNGIAIEAETIYLSTAGKDSYIYFDDSISASGSVLFNSLPQKYHTSSDAEPLAQGSVIFSGENSQSYSKSSSTLASGILSIENGASFKIDASFSHQGGKTIIGQPKASNTVLDVFSSYDFDNRGGGCLTFDLNYNGVYATPLVVVGGNLTLIDKCLTIDASGLDDSSASIALLKVGDKIKYGDDSYYFENGKWVNSKGNSFDTNKILTSTLNNNASLEWENSTLYYKIDGTDETTYVVKGLLKDLTWRGDAFDWYDTNKDRVYNKRQEYDMSCWVATAANVVTYWQDRYAPLYQGDERLSTNRRSDTRTAHDVYQQLLSHYGGKAYGGFVAPAIECWFSSAHGFSVFTDKDNKGAWSTFNVNAGVKYEEVHKYSFEKLRNKFESIFRKSDTGIGLSFTYAKETWLGDLDHRYGAHVVTVWRAKFYTNSLKENICELEYTDSDFDADKLNTMTIKFSDSYGAYIYKYTDAENGPVADSDLYLGGYIQPIIGLTYVETPDGMDEMLTDYNTDTTYYWTGNASEQLWTTENKENTFEGSHLASSSDGWKKECTGGGKTIFAHAYVTPDKLSQATFVFDESVLDPRRRVVVLNDNLSPASVVVRGSDYALEGSGALRNTQLNVESGASLGLSGTNLIGCTIELYGSISNDLYGQGGIRDCTIEVSGNGELWFSSLLLTEGSPGQSGGVIVGDGTFTITNGGTELFGNNIENGCVFGAILDFQGKEYNGTIEQLNENAALNRAFLAILKNQGNVVLDVAEAYWWNYLPINYSAVIDGSTNADGQRIVAKSTLTIQAPQGNASILRTIGSHRVSQSETTADISMSEVWGGTVLAEDVELLTIPLEKTILSGETSITAAALTVSEESTLENHGSLADVDSLVVEYDGVLSGNGVFGGTTVYEGGRVMVGGSPGAPVYDSLSMLSGSELVFCLDGSKPASAAENGWGSGTHSLLTVTQADGLTLESGTAVLVGCSLDFLNSVTVGDTQTLTLVQLGSAADAALLAALQSGTEFKLANADDSLEELSSVGALVHSTSWAQGGNNTLTLSFIVSSCPENALVWTDASGNGTWDSASQNWAQQDGTAALFSADRNVLITRGDSINLAEMLSVGDVVVSSRDNLVLAGSGSLGGDGSLVKEGRGELSITTANTYSGGTYVNGGKLKVLHAEALGLGGVLLQGGELEIGVNGVDNALVNNAVSRLTIAPGVSYALPTEIYNSGELTISGTLNADALTDAADFAATRLDAAGNEGAHGFVRDAGSKVVVVSGAGTLDAAAATVTRDGKDYVLGSDGIAVHGMEVHGGSYLAGSGHSVKLSEVVTAAATHGASATDVLLSGGSLTADRALTGTLSASGTSSLVAENWVVSSSFTNAGTLSISGSIVADGMATESIAATRVDVNGNTGAHGFVKNAGSRFTLVDLQNGGSLDIGALSITRNGTDYLLGNDGVALAEGSVECSAYLIGPGHEVKLSRVVTAAATHGASATDVLLSGGSLTADRALTGTLTASGTSSLVAENWAVNNSFTNEGNLSIRGSIVADGINFEPISATHVDVNGNTGEHGFAKDAGSKFTLVQLQHGGSLDIGPLSISRDGTDYTLHADGTAHAGEATHYGRYTIGTGHEVRLSQVAAAAGNHGEASTHIDLAGGTLIADRALTGQLKCIGNSTLKAENWAVSGSFTNEGTLSISGSIVADGMTAESIAATHVDVDGNTGANGFSRDAGSRFTLVQLQNGGSLEVGELTLSRQGMNYTLGADGVAVAEGLVHYNHYLAGNGHRAAVSDIVRVAARHGVNCTDIHLQGGTLAADAPITGALTLGGGSIELDGRLTVQGDVTFESGTQTTLDLSGWSGADDGEVLVDFGSSTSGYTEESLKLSGIAGEWKLDFDAATGVLTLVEVKDEPLPEPGPEPVPGFSLNLNRNQTTVYNTIRNYGTPTGLLGELAKEIMASRDEAQIKQMLDEMGGAEYATLMSGQQAAASGHMRRLRGEMGSGHQLAGTKTRAYIEAYNHRSELDGDAHGRGYELNESGGQFALEFLGQDSVSGGFAVAAGRSKLQPDGGMTQKSDNTYVDAFVMHRDGAYTGKFSLGVGVHKYDLDRRVAGNAVSADTSGSSVNFMHESAFGVSLSESHSVQVFGAVESSFNRLGAFREKGADTASLQVESQDAWVTTLSLGARYLYSFDAVNSAPAATLSVQGGLEFDFGDTESEVEMNFDGARSHRFRQSGAERDTFGYNLGASLHLPVSAKAAIYASGDAVLRGDSYEVNANVGLQMAF